ncbi:glycosyltransferase family 2 protein [Gammaproteobacteria bacterium]|jgi:GT2 family glycosyltransferase|nr:glycosyltransferase family 2 protein [Gammaproteobacteria bacterium]
MPLSIIIVTHNSGKLLEQCISKLLLSSIDIQIIISDNNSTDGSISSLQQAYSEYNNLIIHYNHANIGFAAANNAAYKYVDTQAKYTLFMNPDCLLDTDTLEKMCTVLDKYPQAALAGGLLCNLDGSEQRGGRRQIPNPWRSLMQSLYLDKIFPNSSWAASGNLLHQPLPKRPQYVDIVSGAFMLVSNLAIGQVGLWDDKYFLHCEDADWCMRFNQAGYKVLFVPQVKILHAKGESSMAKPIFVEWHKHKSMQRFYKKFFYKRYPKVFGWLITAAIWCRFLLVVLLVKTRLVSYARLMGKKSI